MRTLTLSHRSLISHSRSLSVLLLLTPTQQSVCCALLFRRQQQSRFGAIIKSGFFSLNCFALCFSLNSLQMALPLARCCCLCRRSCYCCFQLCLAGCLDSVYISVAACLSPRAVRFRGIRGCGSRTLTLTLLVVRARARVFSHSLLPLSNSVVK